MAAAVLFDYHDPERLAGLIEGVDDSKRLTADRREEVYGRVIGSATRVSVVVRAASTIDRSGLHVTNLDCLSKALCRVAPADRMLCDGFTLPACNEPHERVVKGDSTSAAIAAASIVAKVVRDRLMRRAAERLPAYGFDVHAGYATAMHRDAIVANGPSPLHRMSFASDAYRLHAGEQPGAQALPPAA